jgi:hypothetical protein
VLACAQPGHRAAVSGSGSDPFSKVGRGRSGRGCRSFELAIQFHQLRLKLTRQPKVARIGARKSGLDSQAKRLVKVDDYLLHAKPIPQFESRRQRLSLLGMAAGFDQTDIGQSKPIRAGATRCASSSLAAMASPSGSRNSKAARAEASTTLTAIAVCSDQDRGFAWRG